MKTVFALSLFDKTICIYKLENFYLVETDVNE